MAAKKSSKKTGKNLSMATRAVHAGEPRERYADSITTPIVQTSTFVFSGSRERVRLMAAHAGLDWLRRYLAADQAKKAMNSGA